MTDAELVLKAAEAMGWKVAHHELVKYVNEQDARIAKLRAALRHISHVEEIRVAEARAGRHYIAGAIEDNIKIVADRALSDEEAIDHALAGEDDDG